MERKGLPLQFTLVSGITALILLAAASVGGSAYVSSRNAVRSLFTKLSQETAQRVTQRTLRFLEPAEPYVALTQRLAASGKINPDDRMALLDYFDSAIEANPAFTWASFGSADGAYVSAYRAPGGELRATLREQVTAPPDPPAPTPAVATPAVPTPAVPAPAPAPAPGTAAAAPSLPATTPATPVTTTTVTPAAVTPPTAAPAQPGTRWRDFVRENGAWKPVRDEVVAERYDPRERPWYKAAVAAGKPVWNEPFLFRSNNQPGFTYSAPYLVNGVLRGVWDVEFEVSGLSQFLSTLHVSENGRVYIVTRSGLVVGHPQGSVTEEVNGEKAIARATHHAESRLAKAWNALDTKRTAPWRFAVDGLLVMADAFPAESGIDWIAIIVAPEQDFFGEARAQAARALIISAICALLASLLGALFASRVSAGMRSISDQMERIGRFDLDELKSAEDGESVVREVNMMSGAAGRMKSSLRSFGKYVPRQLVADLLASGKDAVLGGQKQELSTLFSDVEGFTTISESMEPDALVDALGDYFSAMSEEIRRNQGTVDKYIGDAIMAFRGAPRPDAEHALHACRAALAMREKLSSLQEEWIRAGRPMFRARIGVNTGNTLVGNIGSPERMNYTVMGDAVNLASRLEGLNKSYHTSILIGERTAALVKGRMILRPLDFVAVKGKAHAILVHELLGEPGTVDAKLTASLAVHAEALALYRAREFAAAAARFQQVSVTLGREDAPSAVLALRCQEYCVEPPPADWDGSHAMTVK